MITNNETWKNQDSDRNDFDNTTNSFSVNNSPDEFDNTAEEDDDIFTSDEPTEDDDLIDDDEDLTDDDDDDLAVDDDLDATDTDEIPEEGDSDDEGTGYTGQREFDQPQRDADTSISEQIDVTPPNQHEFPSEGPAQTDFSSRPQGRTTGRMVGHEPGTEGI